MNTNFEYIVRGIIDELLPTDLEGLTFIGEKSLYLTDLQKLELPDTVTRIEKSGVGGCNALHEIIIPASVVEIAIDAFSSVGTNASTLGYTLEFRFLHSNSQSSPLPLEAGSGKGAFYNKTARAANIYTDNEAIKNYAWSTDGITATFYHLNGTAW
jgi:hypothetical protein